MKIAILSTPTKHHTYFINKLAGRFDVASLVYERRRLTKDYPTGPFYTEEEDAFEDRFFDTAFGGTASTVGPAIVERMIEVHSVNQAGIASYLEVVAPDVLVVFGTGRIAPEIFGKARWGAINVHRGIAQLYRGLDSDLWAVHENRFDQIGVTIHGVDAGLDTGEIHAQRRYQVGPEDEIFHLRYHTSVMATEMVVDVLERFRTAAGKIEGTPQETAGPYYSAMPLEMKHEAADRFRSYTARLRDVA